MSEKEKDEAIENDLIPIDIPKEINTYDIPELSFEERDERTQCFSVSNVKRHKKRLLYRIYSFFSVLTVFLTLLFSASELINFVMDDMGAQDMLMKRIFGFDSDEAGDSKALVDLILKQTFADLSLEKVDVAPIPEDSTPMPDQNNNTNIGNNDFDTQKPPIDNDQKEENPPSPPATEPPSSDPVDPPLDENARPIIQMDLSLLSYGKNYIYNDTSLSPDLEALSSLKLTDRYDEASDAPLVLIIHTHTTEAFMAEGATHYIDNGEIARSSDPDENMIAVGAEFARVLEKNGIKTIHCTVVHDDESYRLSYQRSAETIAKYLKEYPSIQYVFDLHRDSIVRSSGELVSAIASINGNDCAQIMPVISGGFYGYEENLAFALQLRQALNENHKNLCRPVGLRESTYNQNLAPVSILLEIGTSGNTLSQAKAGAALAAEAVADLIKCKA